MSDDSLCLLFFSFFSFLCFLSFFSLVGFASETSSAAGSPAISESFLRFFLSFLRSDASATALTSSVSRLRFFFSFLSAEDLPAESDDTDINDELEGK